MSKRRGFQEPADDTPVDVKAWFDKLDEYLDEPFMPGGREQPSILSEGTLFEE